MSDELHRWKYTQRDGTVLYGVLRPGTSRLRTLVHHEHDDKVWDHLVLTYDEAGEPNSYSPVTDTEDVNVGQYL